MQRPEGVLGRVVSPQIHSHPAPSTLGLIGKLGLGVSASVASPCRAGSGGPEAHVAASLAAGHSAETGTHRGEGRVGTEAEAGAAATARGHREPPRAPEGGQSRRDSAVRPSAISRGLGFSVQGPELSEQQPALWPVTSVWHFAAAAMGS